MNDPEIDNLKERTVSGVGWSAAAQVINQSFTFVVSIILARLLGPRSYGLIGMINVFVGFAALFGDIGFGAAIIQRKHLDQRHLNSAFWGNVAMGGLIMLVMIACAPLVSRMYNEPLLVPLMIVVSSRFLIDSLSVVQLAILNRSIQFRAQAIIRIGGNCIGGIVGLIMAFLNMGVWSLIVQTLVISAATLILSWRLGKWRPSFSFDLVSFKELFGMSSYVFGFNIINYWSRNLAQLLIGRSAGAAQLGIYSRAYTLMLLPLTQVSGVVGRVMFPALSSIQDDKGRVKRSYLRVLGVVSLITFPMMTGLFIVADHLVAALLGKGWDGVTPLLKIFCGVGILQSMGTTTGWIFLSQGKTKTYFILGLISSLLCMVAYVIGTKWGIVGVATAYLIFTVLEWVPLMAITGRIIDLSILEIVRSLSAVSSCAVLMAITVQLVNWMIPEQFPHWVHLAIEVPAGIGTYLILIVSFKLAAWVEARDTFNSRIEIRSEFPYIKRRRAVDKFP